jgi:hypothetical protein
MKRREFLATAAAIPVAAGLNFDKLPEANGLTDLTIVKLHNIYQKHFQAGWERHAYKNIYAFWVETLGRRLNLTLGLTVLHHGPYQVSTCWGNTAPKPDYSLLLPENDDWSHLSYLTQGAGYSCSKFVNIVDWLQHRPVTKVELYVKSYANSDYVKDLDGIVATNYPVEINGKRFYSVEYKKVIILPNHDLAINPV